jgi:hypothetical protein
MVVDYPDIFTDSAVSAKTDEIWRWGTKGREKVARDIFLKFAQTHLALPSSVKILKETRRDRRTGNGPWLGIEQVFEYDFEARNGFGAVVSESVSIVVKSSHIHLIDGMEVRCEYRSGITSPCR